jgi:hypothetical protein
MALGHVLEDFAADRQFAGLRDRPGDAFPLQVGGEPFEVEMPVAGLVLDINAVGFVDRRHHGVTHGRPRAPIGERTVD